MRKMLCTPQHAIITVVPTLMGAVWDTIGIHVEFLHF